MAIYLFFLVLLSALVLALAIRISMRKLGLNRSNIFTPVRIREKIFHAIILLGFLLGVIYMTSIFINEMAR